MSNKPTTKAMISLRRNEERRMSMEDLEKLEELEKNGWRFDYDYGSRKWSASLAERSLTTEEHENSLEDVVLAAYRHHSEDLRDQVDELVNQEPAEIAEAVSETPADDPDTEDSDETDDDEDDDEDEVSGSSAIPRRFTRTLNCELTSEELLVKGDELGQKINRYDEVDAELKNVSAGYKGQLKTLNKEIRDLTKAVVTKKETRDVECYERLDYESSTVRVIRSDTYEAIEARPMTEREKQKHLFAVAI